MFKNICIVTANRSDYAKIKLLIKELSLDPEINLNVIVTGSMCSEKYGTPVNDLLEDGISLKYIFEPIGANDSPESILNSMGIQIIQESCAIKTINPDLLIVVGDRWDILPSILCCTVKNIPIAHIQGGELSGNIDDTIRHAITKFSHIHFVSNETCKRQLIQLGEYEQHIHVVGCPGLDVVRSIDLKEDIDITEFQKYSKNQFALSRKDKYFVVLLHPNTTDELDLDIDIVFDSINSFSNKVVCFYPNNDYHNSEIVQIIRKNTNFIKFSHLPMDLFLKVVAHASCIIGNSSAGIREAASLATPVINIGTRQKNRERNKNIIDVNCDSISIKEAIKTSISQTTSTHNIYGDGKSVPRIINILKKYEKLVYKNVC